LIQDRGKQGLDGLCIAGIFGHKPVGFLPVEVAETEKLKAEKNPAAEFDHQAG
jgi:hypothetical protein